MSTVPSTSREMPTERTPLRAGSNPSYVFLTSYNRSYKNKVRRFQCCICATLLAIFVTTLVITISYTVNHDFEDINGTDPDIVPGLQTLLRQSYPIDDNQDVWTGPIPNSADIELALTQGLNGLKSREAYEEIGPTLTSDSPSFKHQQAVKTLPLARQWSKSGYVMDIATQYIVQNTSPKRGGSVGRGPRLDADWLPPEVCNEGVRSNCSMSPYRSYDGMCNNLDHPRSWGVAMRPFRRYIAPDYADGVSAPRKATDGSDLPSAREVSTKIHRPIYRDDPNFTVMLAVWGQLLDHDITATALSQGKLGKPISCCHWSLLRSGMKKHPECFIVPLRNGDPYYEDFNITCMEFVRSAPSPACSLGPREQMNQVSSYIDGSVVYGSNEELAKQLRTFQGGQLKALITPDGRELLPISTNPNDGCNREEEMAQGRYCFMCGDPRANENIHLVTLHLLLARQHNKIARKLSGLNPSWDDEQLYQESRKIVGAIMQHITYNEFVPVLLGPALMAGLNLQPLQTGYSDTYRGNVDASVANEFAAAAFRFGHTLLPGLIRVIGNDTSSQEYIELHKMLFNPFKLYDAEFLDNAIRGAMNSSIERADAYFTSQVTQHLFENKEAKNKSNVCGLDLVSLNIQRGRDHGLPGYVHWRKYCGLSVPGTFEDLSGMVDPDSQTRLSLLYKSVEDIDVYTGALSEIPINGSLVGPTITCLLTDQFVRLKLGDRFWYETGEQPQAFTTNQLSEIRKISLAKLICDTSDGVEKAQPRVMQTARSGNERVSCTDLPGIDLEAWRENSYNNLKLARVSVKTNTGVKTTKAASKPALNSLKLGASIMNGTLMVNGQTLWYGKLPLTIPLEPLASVLSPGETISTTEPVSYDLGIVWKGSLVSGPNKTATLVGSFSVPFKNESSDGVVWVNGALTAQLDVEWNTSESGDFATNGLFSSPVYLRAASLKTSSPSAANFNLKSYSHSVQAVGAGKTAQMAPIVLFGDYSDDKSAFSWSGKVTLILPAANLLKATPYYYKKYRIGATVTSGTISAQNVRVWSGSFPMSIPIHALDTVAKPDDGIVVDEPVVYGHGIVWNGKLTVDSTGVGKLTGSYSLPRFVHSNGITNFTILWYNGGFDLGLKLLWNITGEEMLTIDGLFTTPVYFSCDAEYDGLKNTLPSSTLAGLSLGYSGTPRELPVGGEPGPTAPLILHGAFADDGNMFYWSGNMTLVLPRKVEVVDYGKQQLTATSTRVRTPLCVLGGIVKIGGDTIWSDSTPLAFPAKPFDSVTVAPGMDPPPGAIDHEILFTATIENEDTVVIRIHGSFSAPSYVQNTAKWTNGEFSFRAKRISNTTLESGTYMTSVYFNERRPIHYADVDTATLVNNGETPSDTSTVSPIGARHAVFVLYGSYSLDRTIFLWNGNATFISDQSSTPKQTAAAVSSGLSQRFGARVTGGSLKIQGNTVWSGVLPISFPTYPFDDVVDDTGGNLDAPTYGHGILWKGMLRKSETGGLHLTGTFSLPIHHHGVAYTVSWYNGNAEFELEQTWTGCNYTTIDFEGSFSSPVYFQTRQRYDYLKKSSVTALDTAGLMSYNVPSEAASYSKIMLVLQGTYSDDSSRFLWSGDVTIVARNKPMLTAAPSAVRLGGFVTGGSLTSQGQNIWAGNRIPLILPSKPFDTNVEIEPTSTIPVYGHGILWKGYLTSDGPGTVRIWGTYSLPQYSHTTNVSVGWYSGDFAFVVRLEWNNTLHMNLNGVYTTPVYFQPKYGFINDTANVATLTQEKLVPEASSSPDLIPDAPVAPLILLGSYNADKTLFIWSGNVTIIVPTEANSFEP